MRRVGFHNINLIADIRGDIGFNRQYKKHKPQQQET
jgi:hypothetical protein